MKLKKSLTPPMKKTIVLPEEPKISGPHVARSLDKDPSTIRRWAREGCPCYPIAIGMTLFKLSEVIAWRATRPAFQSKKDQATKAVMGETQAAEVAAE